MPTRIIEWLSLVSANTLTLVKPTGTEMEYVQIHKFLRVYYSTALQQLVAANLQTNPLIPVVSMTLESRCRCEQLSLLEVYQGEV
jgi:hypothetical protein